MKYSTKSAFLTVRGIFTGKVPKNMQRGRKVMLFVCDVRFGLEEGKAILEVYGNRRASRS